METEAWRAFDWNDQLLTPAPLDQSTRARMVREINRIALRHKWEGAVEAFLDMKGASYLADLTDPQVEDLHGRMQGYLDAAQTGCDLEWSLPAR